MPSMSNEKASISVFNIRLHLHKQLNISTKELILIDKKYNFSSY